MVKRIGGLRRKSRHKLRKNIRKKGKISLRNYFQALKPGDRVKLCAESGVQGAMYHLRFHGKSGVVSGKRGECYEIKIKNGNKQKNLIVHPIHLKKI